MRMQEYAVHADYAHISKYLPKIKKNWAKNGSKFKTQNIAG